MQHFSPTLCGLEYGRDVVPWASPYNSIGVRDDEEMA
jgi:hypothetical protein